MPPPPPHPAFGVARGKPSPWRARQPRLFRAPAPPLGALLAVAREAYACLPKSVDEFLSARELAAAMEAAGLRVAHRRSLALGNAALIVGEAP